MKACQAAPVALSDAPPAPGAGLDIASMRPEGLPRRVELRAVAER
jgi:hypothetical protein